MKLPSTSTYAERDGASYSPLPKIKFNFKTSKFSIILCYCVTIPMPFLFFSCCLHRFRFKNLFKNSYSSKLHKCDYPWYFPVLVSYC